MPCCEENLSGLDDEALLARYVSDGDESAIGILYLRHAERLRAYGRHHLHDDEAARDLVQDTWEAVLTYRGLAAAGNFRGLLYRVAHHLVLSWWRRERRQHAHRQVFLAEGGEIRPGDRVYPGSTAPLPRRAIDGTCTYCGGKARSGKTLCHAHAMRRSRGATEAEMRKPIRRRTR